MRKKFTTVISLLLVFSMFFANLGFAASTNKNKQTSKDQKETVEAGDSLNLENTKVKESKKVEKPEKNVTKLNRNSGSEEEEENTSFLSYNFIFYLIYKFKTTDIFKFIE